MDWEKVGTIDNYYGEVHVCKDGGSFYWSIEDYSGRCVEQIPEYLYDALLKFERERMAGVLSFGPASIYP